MFGLGFSELVVILILILLVVGPSKLPDIARGLGKGMREIRRATRELESVPEIRDLKRAVDDIRAPVESALRERVLDPEAPEPPPPSPPASPPEPGDPEPKP